jgi:regulator of protease activity HflC (stomatin/prohibitin superfamily)
MDSETKDNVKIGFIIVYLAVGALFLLIGGCWGVDAVASKYAVWAKGKAGQAELAKADYNRQIAVREAKAKKESAVLLAQAEIERARGVAKANKIIGTSLQGNEDYLRYLWVNGLHEGKNQVIYIPTETNMPIMEAGRVKKEK